MYIVYIRRYPEILGRSCFKKIGKNIVSRSLLHQHLMGIPDVAMIYKTLYGDLMVWSPWWGPGTKSQKPKLS